MDWSWDGEPEADGAVHVLSHGKRHLLVCPVHGTGRGIDQVPYLRVPGDPL